jgi:hypothetical protein
MRGLLSAIVVLVLAMLLVPPTLASASSDGSGRISAPTTVDRHVYDGNSQVVTEMDARGPTGYLRVGVQGQVSRVLASRADLLRPPPGVAAEAGAGSGDGIVLGLRNQGLEQTATKVGGRTLLNDSDWQATLQKAIANPSTKFTVSLDGMSGSSTYGQIMSAAQRGAAGVGGYTDWEMAQLYGAGRLPGVTFVRGGAVVPNPFG